MKIILSIICILTFTSCVQQQQEDGVYWSDVIKYIIRG